MIETARKDAWSEAHRHSMAGHGRALDDKAQC